MIASVGVVVTFPLVFVAGRTRGLPLISAGVLALQVPLAWAGGELFELEGLALALALSTSVVLAALLVELRAFALALRGLATASAVTAGTARSRSCCRPSSSARSRPPRSGLPSTSPCSP